MAKITIRDIARESGYSLGSVSRALNNAPGVSAQARAAILAIAEKHHYQLNPNAKYLKQKAGSGILILIKGNDPRSWLMARDIEKLARKAGYEVEVKSLDESEDEVRFALVQLGVRTLQGILFLGSKLSHFIDNFSKIRVPCVLVGQDVEDLGFANLSSICFDEAASAQFAMESLFSHGARTIVVIGESLEDSPVSSNRFQGIQFACYARGINFDLKDYLIADQSYDGGYRAMETLFSQRKRNFPDAVLTFQEKSALGIMRSAQDHGMIIGEDLSLITLDGTSLCGYLNPRLSSMQRDFGQMAQKAFSLLQEMIEGKAGARHIKSPCQLFQGESLS